MQKGDLIKTLRKGAVQVGKVQSIDLRMVYVWSATTGQNDVYSLDVSEPATQAEYDEQVELRLNPPPKKPAVSTPVKASVKKPAQTYRWICADCGNRYNGHECPSCGCDDRLPYAGRDQDTKAMFL